MEKKCQSGHPKEIKVMYIWIQQQYDVICMSTSLDVMWCCMLFLCYLSLYHISIILSDTCPYHRSIFQNQHQQQNINKNKINHVWWCFLSFSFLSLCRCIFLSFFLSLFLCLFVWICFSTLKKINPIQSNWVVFLIKSILVVMMALAMSTTNKRRYYLKK